MKKIGILGLMLSALLVVLPFFSTEKSEQQKINPFPIIIQTAKDVLMQGTENFHQTSRILEAEKQKTYTEARIESEKALSLYCQNKLIQIINETENPKKKAKNYQDIANVSKITEVTLGKPYMNIRSDAIGLHTKVYFGDDGNIIDYGVGQYSGSALPGDGKMILLDSHNHTYFKPLKNSKVGDEIILETFYGNYIYRVFDIQVMDEKDLETYVVSSLDKEEEILVCYTCYPFQKTEYRKYQRLVVFAK